ncbi:MAG: NAD(P)-binding protein [Candidatus Paceibacterota bacterium]|jgi:flavin-dependent dehydrogenase
MENKKLKVAIIGGGVMGLYISWRLSEKGHDVSVFDKRKEDELYKKPCSALVSERIKQFIPISDECVENIINSCIINFPKKKIRLNFYPKHLALNKNRLMQILLNLNKKNRTNFFFEKEIKELPKGFDRIIGCDGAISVTRKLLNLNSPKMRMGVQVISNKEDYSDITETFSDGGGFSWKIPKGKTIEFGVLGEKSIEEIKKIVKRENLNEKDIKGALVPSPGCFLKNAGLIFPKEDNITLCGDTMGLTKPWSGGGIIWGLHAADILIKTFPDFKEYKRQTVGFFRLKVLKGQISNFLVQFLGKHFPYIIPKQIRYDNDFPSLLVAFKGEK